MTIGEVSKKCNISTDTLRYYEKIGLINKVTKHNGKRSYSNEDIKQIDFIKCMKNAGFLLEDIVTFLDLYNKGDDTLKKRIDMLLNQRKKLEDEIEEKKSTLAFLNHKIDVYNDLLKNSLK